MAFVARIKTIDLLQQQFLDQIISQNCDVNWPTRSWGLTQYDFYLWGFVRLSVRLKQNSRATSLQSSVIA